MNIIVRLNNTIQPLLLALQVYMVIILIIDDSATPSSWMSYDHRPPGEVLTLHNTVPLPSASERAPCTQGQYIGSDLRKWCLYKHIKKGKENKLVKNDFAPSPLFCDAGI